MLGTRRCNIAATETAICNLSLLEIGQSVIDSIDGTSANEVKCKLIYDQDRDELLEAGPELGWKFAKQTVHGIDNDEITITAFAQDTATTTTVTGTHTLIAGDMVVITDTTNYDGTFDVVSVSTTVSFVITKVFISDDATGTANWTSEEFACRFLIPSSKKVTKTMVGGIELTDWIRDGKYVVTNMESEEVDMKIVRSITDVTLFPDHFVKALKFKMAVSLTHAITQDLALADRLTLKMEDAIKKAIAVDERGKYVQESSSSWVDMGNTREIVE